MGEWSYDWEREPDWAPLESRIGKDGAAAYMFMHYASDGEHEIRAYKNADTGDYLHLDAVGNEWVYHSDQTYTRCELPREHFWGYCRTDDGPYIGGVKLDGPEAAARFCRRNMPYFSDVRIVDAENNLVLLAQNGQVVFPSRERETPCR
jgi:hypothetical protein